MSFKETDWAAMFPPKNNFGGFKHVQKNYQIGRRHPCDEDRQKNIKMFGCKAIGSYELVRQPDNPLIQTRSGFK